MPVDFYYVDDEGRFRCRMETRRCAYMFPNNEQCKNETVIGLQYCWQHLETQLHLRIIRENRIPKGVIAFSRQHERLHEGLPVFLEGDLICQYKGERISEKTKRKRYGNFSGPYMQKLQALPGHRRRTKPYIDAAKKGYVASFIEDNGLQQPNARFEFIGNNRHPRIAVVALKDIDSREEILIDYGQNYYQHINPEADYGQRVVDSGNTMAGRRTQNKRRRHGVLTGKMFTG